MTDDNKEIEDHTDVDLDKAETQSQEKEATTDLPVDKESHNEDLDIVIDEAFLHHHSTVFRRVFISIGILIFVVAGSFIFLSGRGFPSLEPGAYLGEISGIFAGDLQTPVPFYVEQSADGKDLLFFIHRQGWAPQHIGNTGFGDSLWSSSKPVKLSSNGTELLLTRSLFVSEGYGGAVHDLTHGFHGRWRLTRLPAEAESKDPSSPASTRLWLLLKADLDGVQSRHSFSQSRIPQYKKEVARLMDFIDQKEALRENADRKLVEEKGKVEDARKRLAQKQDELKKLETKAELAYRVTDMGKLVYLSRESLERDRRWLKIMLMNNPGIESKELNENYQRAERIMNLRRQIEAENDKIYTLLHQGQSSLVPYGPSSVQ